MLKKIITCGSLDGRGVWGRMDTCMLYDWRRQWHPTPALLPGKSQGWRNLVGRRTRLSNFTFTFHFHAFEKEMATHSSVLAWRIPGTGEPGGLPSVGSHRVGHNWSDLAAAAECIMWNARLDESQAGLKITRSISNLRWADDTNFMAKSKEELNSLLGE